MSFIKRVVTGSLALAAGAVIWIPCMHLCFAHSVENFRSGTKLSPKAEQLAARHLHMWTEPELREEELSRMRRSNAEWEFMGRTFLVWSLGEMGLRDPQAKKEYLPVMDKIIEETVQLEREKGIYFFLMPYARGGSFMMQPARSEFLDSEIAIMLAARRMLEEKTEYQPMLKERIDAMEARMKQGPVLSAESYPNECWSFDNTAALAAMRLEDHLDKTDHDAFIKRWLAMAKEKLTDPQTGILFSSYTVEGRVLDGPEGSTIWMTSHFLRLADEGYARDQYDRAKKELGRSAAGFAWSREWPKSWRGAMDIDSGLVIPGLDISPGASGMAFIAASSFGDADYLSALATTLDFSGFPSRSNGRLKYCASNQVGDAAFLYASVLGPMWQTVDGGRR